MRDDDDVVSTTTTTTMAGTSTPPTPPVERGLSLLQRRQRGLASKLSLDVNTIVKERASQDLPSTVGGSGLSERYDLLQALGEGSTGVVYAARQKADGREVALKVMRMHDEELIISARKEFEILRGIEHPHIVRVHDFFTYSMGAVLVMDFFPGQCLEAAVRTSANGRFPESDARGLFAILLDAIDYLHQHGIIHRDVKAQNVLVSSDLSDLRLVDFNTARQVTDGGALTMTGTADYMPPEVLLGEELTEASDVWAAGLCLHLMLSGTLPLERNLFSSHMAFGRAVVHSSRREMPLGSPEWRFLDLSGPCLETLRWCLEVDHSKRPAPSAVLSSAWLNSCSLQHFGGTR